MVARQSRGHAPFGPILKLASTLTMGWRPNHFALVAPVSFRRGCASNLMQKWHHIVLKGWRYHSPAYLVP